MDFNQDCAEWVYDTISKMDDGEAQVFGTMVVHDLLHTDQENNERLLRRGAHAWQREMTDQVAKALLDHLNAGNDPEQAVAIAAAVGISKADDPWKFQERNHGQFGRMTHNEYKDHAAQVRAHNRANPTQPMELKTHDEMNLDRFNASNYAMADAPNTANVFRETQGFQQKWNSKARNESTSSPTYRRISAGGELVQNLGIAANSPSMATAGLVANYAGQFGPEAEKVVGPSLRRIFYRYRGTERTPEPEIDARIETEAKDILRSEGRPYGRTKQTVTLADGSQKTVEVPHTTALQSLSPEERTEAAETAVVRHFMGTQTADGRTVNSRIPSSRLADLQRQAGKVTPSEGIIIDDRGNISHQAVGYAEDHYLPFNLSNLSDLKGGSYVRTRESGGPTSEDIYTGLLSGARSMTVVSNSGLFTVTFDDTLRGGRRYGDKAKQMVDRYEKLLDAVQSKQVDNPDRRMTAREKAEIRIKTEDEIAEKMPWASDAQKDQWVKDKIAEAEKKPRLDPTVLANIERAANEEPDEKLRRVIYREKLDEAQTNALSRKYALDGEGYSAALDALQEQFPYFIADVNYKTKSGARNFARTDLGEKFNTGEDKGYIKPKFIHPKDSRAGYFDPTINGEEKFAGSEDQFQNWSYNSRNQAGSIAAPVGAATDAAAVPAAGTETFAEATLRVAGATQREAEAAKLRIAAVNDANEWVKVDQDLRADQKPGLDPVRYGTIHEWANVRGTAGEEEFLADKTKVDKLAEEVVRADDELGSRLQGPALQRQVKNLRASSARATLSEDVTKLPMAPAQPRQITDAQAQEALKRDDIRRLIGHSQDELINFSNSNREAAAGLERDDPQARQRPEYMEAMKNTYAIELARAVKAKLEAQGGSLNQLPQTATTPATTLQATTPDPNVAGPEDAAPPIRRRTTRSAKDTLHALASDPNHPDNQIYKRILADVPKVDAGRMTRVQFMANMAAELRDRAQDWPMAAGLYRQWTGTELPPRNIPPLPPT